MFFNDLSAIRDIAKKNDFSIFFLPRGTNPSFESSLTINPDEKHKIGIDQIREVLEKNMTKQKEDFYILINDADYMNIAAQNAMLKFLEEPAKHYHIIFIAHSLSALLPTILSRGNLYIYQESGVLEQAITAPDNIKNYARKLIATSGKKLVDLANDITKDKEYKKKDNSRIFVLQICEVAIEMTYKSFFKTNNSVFLKKLEHLLLLYDNLKKNGNIKLHLIADLC